jgi:poly(3-hydroxybutyrate) depolymerase
MAIQLEVNGVLRTYDLLLPTGFEHWFQQCATNGRNGLPLVVALHGWGQHPEVLQAQWDFITVANLSTSYDDKFVVLVPHGLGPDDRLSWNSHPQFHLMNPDDLATIVAMVDHAEGLIKNFLLSRGVTLGSPAVAFDVKRRHLFGYSSGALMALNLAGLWTNTFASVVALAGANGAKSFQSGTEYRYPPSLGTGTQQTSLWLAVGGADTTNPPGSDAAPGPGNADTFTFSGEMKLALQDAGVPANEAQIYSYAVRKAVWTVQSYLDYLERLFVAPNDFPNNYLAPKADGTLPGVNNTLTRNYRMWARPLDPTNNPRVWFDYDTAMTHKNLLEQGKNRWMTPTNVWAFMKSVAKP